MIILNVVLKPVGGPTTAYTKLGYATSSRSFGGNSWDGVEKEHFRYK